MLGQTQMEHHLDDAQCPIPNEWLPGTQSLHLCAATGTGVTSGDNALTA